MESAYWAVCVCVCAFVCVCRAPLFSRPASVPPSPDGDAARRYVRAARADYVVIGKKGEGTFAEVLKCRSIKVCGRVGASLRQLMSSAQDGSLRAIKIMKARFKRCVVVTACVAHCAGGDVAVHWRCFSVSLD